MDKYITLIGTEHRTAINSLWAVLKKGRFKPDELFLILDEEVEFLDELEKDFKRLLESYKVDSSVESTLFSDVHDLRVLIEDSSNGLMALDISAASKYTTAKVLMDKGENFFDYIFFLEIDDERERKKLLPTIERNRVRLLDLRSKHAEEI